MAQANPASTVKTVKQKKPARPNRIPVYVGRLPIESSDAVRYTNTPLRQAILQDLYEHQGELHFRELRKHLGIRTDRLEYNLGRMQEKGRTIERVSADPAYGPRRSNWRLTSTGSDLVFAMHYFLKDYSKLLGK